jgi:UDP-N-acetylglucosamine 2-epimerase
MIHIFVGTKAQFIKIAPIMLELDQRGIIYNFIDAGQHAGLTGNLVTQFGLRQPDVFLRDEKDNIDTIFQAFIWVVLSLWKIIFLPNKIREKVFRQDDGGICLIHGDTLTTLISLLYAKRCGLEVAHVEAGLRSYNLFDPFPEEIIRLIAMHYSDVLFTPSDWAFENLKKMGYEDKTVNIGSNTIVDTLRYVDPCIEERPSESYVLATIHRVETIFSRSRLSFVVASLERIAMDQKVLFVLHEPTRQQLTRFGLYERIIQNTSIQVLSLKPYFHFISLLAGATFIVTDGGSIQEEAYYLNIPCLIMRMKTERIEGLGVNAYLSEFKEKRFEKFLAAWSDFQYNDKNIQLRPSSMVVDYIDAKFEVR